MNTLLSGKVLWSYDHEISPGNSLNDDDTYFSGLNPFHTHKGDITLTYDRIIIKGDEEMDISLINLDHIHLGFDETFPRTLVKHRGLFWQPLRLSLLNGKKLYLIIDYRLLIAKNQIWFDTLNEILYN